MRTVRHPVPLLLLLAGVLAAPAGPAQAQPGQLATLSHRHDLLEAHRARLERRLQAQVKRISRLKSQPAGITRDFQLKRTLRDNQALAARLTRLQQQIRALNGQLVAAYNRAIAGASDPAERRRLRQRRRQLTRDSQGQGSRIITDQQASPLDSPEDLEEKADLLKDSEEKVRRQLARIARQIKVLEHRAKLRRHARAADDSPFMEESLRRRAKTTRSAPAATEGVQSDSVGKKGMEGPPGGFDSNSSAAPAPAGGSGAPRSSSGGGLSLSVRGVLDPSIVRELDRSRKQGDTRANLAALEKARKRLEQVARKLDSRASALRKKARSTR